MHIIYHFKAFEKGFQMNVNASRNISNTFQSTLKNSGDINWSIFVRISEKGANLRPPRTRSWWVTYKPASFIMFMELNMYELSNCYENA